MHCKDLYGFLSDGYGSKPRKPPRHRPCLEPYPRTEWLIPVNWAGILSHEKWLKAWQVVLLREKKYDFFSFLLVHLGYFPLNRTARLRFDSMLNSFFTALPAGETFSF